MLFRSFLILFLFGVYSVIKKRIWPVSFLWLVWFIVPILRVTVKGTTILGWDPKTSIGKTLRKPEPQLKEFMSGGKVAMRNFHKSIRGKEAILNGRINKDMILLKTY